MTHDEYIKRRDEIVTKNEDDYLTPSDLQKAIDELVLAVIGLNTQGVIRTGGVMDWKREGAMNTVRNNQRSIVKGDK